MSENAWTRENGGVRERVGRPNHDRDRLDWTNTYPYMQTLNQVRGWRGNVYLQDFQTVHNFWRRHFMLTRSIMDPLFTPICIRLVDGGIDFQQAILIASFQVQVIRQTGVYQEITREDEMDWKLTNAQEEYRQNI